MSCEVGHLSRVQSGRVVIPGEMLRRLNLDAGDLVVLKREGGALVIQKMQFQVIQGGND